MYVCVCVCVFGCLGVWVFGCMGVCVCCLNVCGWVCVWVCGLTPSTPHQTLCGKYIRHRTVVMDFFVTLRGTYILCVIDSDFLW
jgi:hypothetical protein